jgi:hypothetical protein
MRLLKIYKLLKEQIENDKLYRICSIKYLIGLLKNQKITVFNTGKSDAFTSLTLNYKELEQTGNYGNVLIAFNRKEFEKINKCQEIFYDKDFFEKFPNICKHVTAYQSEDDFYQNKGFKNKEEAWENNELDWETLISDYEKENEVVAPKTIKINSKCIDYIKVSSILFSEKKELFPFEKKYKIKYEKF